MNNNHRLRCPIRRVSAGKHLVCRRTTLQCADPTHRRPRHWQSEFAWGSLWEIHGKSMGNPWEIHGKAGWVRILAPNSMLMSPMMACFGGYPPEIVSDEVRVFASSLQNPNIEGIRNGPNPSEVENPQIIYCTCEDCSQQLRIFPTFWTNVLVLSITHVDSFLMNSSP